MESNNNKGYYNNNYNSNYNKKNQNRNHQNNYYNRGSNYPNYSQKNNYSDYRYQREAMMNPYYMQSIINRTQIYIYTKYRHLIDINVKNQGIGASLEQSSLFYVIKSFSEEDVHKSIKYGVWSSSKNGNQTLSNSFKLAKEKDGNVFLFFSCNGSGRFVGMARMKSPCDNEKSFDYWTQDGKWPGVFEVEWIFIKDVPFREFKKIIITMRDGETKSVSNSRDVQEVPYSQSKTMVEIFEAYQNVNTILEHFEYYDTRQDNYEKTLQMQKAELEPKEDNGKEEMDNNTKDEVSKNTLKTEKEKEKVKEIESKAEILK